MHYTDTESSHKNSGSFLSTCTRSTLLIGTTVKLQNNNVIIQVHTTSIIIYAWNWYIPVYVITEKETKINNVHYAESDRRIFYASIIIIMILVTINTTITMISCFKNIYNIDHE